VNEDFALVLGVHNIVSEQDNNLSLDSAIVELLADFNNFTTIIHKSIDKILNKGKLVDIITNLCQFSHLGLEFMAILVLELDTLTLRVLIIALLHVLSDESNVDGEFILTEGLLNMINVLRVNKSLLEEIEGIHL